MKKSRIRKDSWLTNNAIAHRGFHNDKSPENSLAAFKSAIEMGYAIELDIHLIKHNRIIVFHDNNVKRMTGANIKTCNLTLEMLETLRLFNTEEKIPLFKEVLELVDGKVPLLIEIKNTYEIGVIERILLEELKAYKGEYMVQSFNPYRLKWLKNNAPHIIRGQLSGLYRNNNMSFFGKFILKNLLSNFISSPDFVNYEIDGLNKPVIKFLKFLGYPVICWTAKSYDEYIKALLLCDNAVFENFEAEVKKNEY